MVARRRMTDEHSRSNDVAFQLLALRKRFNKRLLRNRYSTLPQFRQHNPIGLGPIPNRLLATGQRLGDCFQGHALFRQRVELVDLRCGPWLLVPLEDRLAHYSSPIRILRLAQDRLCPLRNRKPCARRKRVSAPPTSTRHRKRSGSNASTTKLFMTARGNGRRGT